MNVLRKLGSSTALDPRQCEKDGARRLMGMKIEALNANLQSCCERLEVTQVYKHILIATDGSQLAAKAVTQGLELAKALGAKATAVTVSEPWNFVLAALAEREHLPDPLADYDLCTEAAAERFFWVVHQTAKRLAQACATVHVKNQHPAEGILQTAQAMGCDLIVMASHGRRGFAKLLLGSRTTRILTLSPIAVLVPPREHVIG
jgi:nucleotide-binding universal stress UspA family protein